ncbi:MAG: hypothetical protein ACJ786_14455 [Catenulispora sp.]
MTARRSSATERRGGGDLPRPTALSAAALAVLLAGSGCASRNASTESIGPPVNQDTAAAALAGGLPHTPPAAAAHAAAFGVTALPSATTSTAPVNGWTDDSAPPGLGTVIVKEMAPPNHLTVGLTPEENPAAGKPVLEVVGMPTWLWIEGLPPALRTTLGNGHVITDFVVMDKVEWNTGSDAGPKFSCGNGTSSPTPGKGYGIPYDIAFDPTGDGLANACVNTFSSPYYSYPTSGDTIKATGAGVYTLSATVTWHIAYTVTSNNTTSAPQAVIGDPERTTQTDGVALRVGEIQALASSP